MKSKINIFNQKFHLHITITLPAFLTDKELSLLKQLLKGKTLTDIAHESYRSIKTVSCQKNNIYRKLGIKNDLSLWEELILNPKYEIIATGKKSSLSDFYFWKDRLDIISKRIVFPGENKKCFLYFQPIFNSESAKISGCEVFPYQVHDDISGVFPEHLSPVAESVISCILTSPLIRKITSESEKMESFISEVFYVYIRTPVKNILTPGFERQCRKIQELTITNKIKVILGLTKTEEIQDIAPACITINRLKKYRVLFSLNDVWDGYSTYLYLQMLAVDFIKLDKALIHQSEVDNFSRVIMDNIITLAEKLNIGIIADGIEKTEQEETIKNKNIKYVQGSLYSRPVSDDDFIPDSYSIWYKMHNTEFIKYALSC